MNEKDQFQHKPKVESNENNDSFTLNLKRHTLLIEVCLVDRGMPC